MHILEEYFKEYYSEEVISKIKVGEATISGIRLHEENMQDEYVYIGHAKQFNMNEFADNIICINKSDYIIIKTNNLNSVFNTALACLSYYSDWEQKCLENAYNTSPISTMVDMVNSIFKENFIMINYSLLILGYSNRTKEIETESLSTSQKLNIDYWNSITDKKILPLHLVNQISSLRGSAYTDNTGILFFNNDILPILFTTAKTNKQTGMHLILTNVYNPPTEAKKQLFKKAKEILELWAEVGYDKKDSDDGRSLSHKMFRTNEVKDTVQLNSRLTQFGWKENCQKQFYQIMHPNGNSVTIRQVSYNLNMINGCYCGYDKEYCFLIINLDLISENDLFNKVIRTIKTTTCRAGFSNTFTDIRDVFAQQKLAEIALMSGNTEKGSISSFKDYALKGIKEGLKKNHNGDDFIYHPAVKIIEDYDLEHEMDLSKTFLTYLLCGQNCTQTSKKLFLHRNTVEYRVNKALDLINVDFNDEEELAYLMISFFLRYEDTFKKTDQLSIEKRKQKFIQTNNNQ